MLANSSVRIQVFLFLILIATLSSSPGAANIDLGDVYRRTLLPAVRYQEREETETVPLPSQAHWFSLAALGLLLLESLMREGPRPTTAQVAAQRRRAA